MPDEKLPHERRPKWTMPFPFDRRHLPATLDARVNQPKRLKVWIDVQDSAEIGNPISNGNADFGDWPGSYANARMPRQDCSLNIEIGKQSDESRAQALQVFLNSPTQSVERQDRIDRHLAGDMEHAAAAAVQPVDWQTATPKPFDSAIDMGPTSLPSDRYQPRMFTNDQHRVAAIASYFINKTVLEIERRLEIHESQ